MKLRTTFILASLLLFFSCQNDEIDRQDNSQDNKTILDAFNEKNIYKGQMLVKLSKEPAKDIKFQATRSGEAVETGLENIDEILNSLGIKKMERVFPPAGEFEKRTREAGLHLWYLIEFDEQQPMTRAASSLVNSENIKTIEPVRRVFSVGRGRNMIKADLNMLSNTRATSSFNDPFLESQWHYNNIGKVPNNNGGTTSAGFASGADMRLFDAWSVSTGSPEVIVCVVDGGVDPNHEDLKDNMWVNTREIAGNGKDDDNNGYKDDIYGFNFVDNQGIISPHSHGTHVAGTISAVNNNGKGVAGIAGGNRALGQKGARIMTCQIFKHRPNSDNDYNASDANTAKAIKYGADNGAVISQNSWGYEEPVEEMPEFLKDAIDYFVSKAGTNNNGVQTGPMKGGIVIFAAGNEEFSSIQYPGAYEKVISVAAMGPNYKKSTYSNYGSYIKITAPGGDMESMAPKIAVRGVLSTMSGWNGEENVTNEYYFMDGTSMAAPHVSGVAALIISAYGGIGEPGFTPEKLKSLLLSNAYDISSYNPGLKDKLGAGCLNAAKSLYDAIIKIPIADVTMKSWDTTLKILATDHLKKPDGSTLTFKVVSDKASVIDAKMENKYIVLTKKGLGTARITVSATDASSRTASLSFTVTSITNNKPIIIKEFTDLQFSSTGAQKTFILTEYFNDPDGDNLVYEATSSNSNIVNCTMANETLAINIKGKGTANVTVKASDTGGLYASQTFKVTVGQGSASINLYPSPAKTVLNISSNDTYSGSANIKVYSSAGTKVIDRMVNVNFPSSAYQVSVEKLSPGTYSLVLDYNNKKYKKDFLKR